jgi:hypothetical protein
MGRHSKPEDTDTDIHPIIDVMEVPLDEHVRIVSPEEFIEIKRHERFTPMFRGGLHDTEPIDPVGPEPPPPVEDLELEPVRHGRGLILAALIGTALALLAVVLAVWIFFDGHQCTAPPAKLWIPVSVPPPPR